MSVANTAQADLAAILALVDFAALEAEGALEPVDRRRCVAVAKDGIDASRARHVRHSRRRRDGG